MFSFWLGAAVGPAADALEPYRFPLSADPATLTWEEPHWDGSNAVDLGVHSGYELDAPERAAFYESEAIAVTSGVASRLDNPRGGTAVVLHGDDGRTYYYAHLSSTPIEAPVEVPAGAPLGTIGRTGTWTQFLEPHLHFSIAEGHRYGTDWTADVPGAAWLRRTFGVTPVRRVTDAYRADYPEGLPLFGAPRVTTSFAESYAANPLLAGVTVVAAGRAVAGGEGADRDGEPAQAELPPAELPRVTLPPAPMRAPMTGIARVHLDTPLGVRVQISNSLSSRSVIMSGRIRPVVQTGELVYGESIVGYVDGPLHYMVFAAGRPVDPLD